MGVASHYYEDFYFPFNLPLDDSMIFSNDEKQPVSTMQTNTGRVTKLKIFLS